MSEDKLLKKITDVPIVENLADGDTLLLERAGESKRVPANKVGGSGGIVIYAAEPEPGNFLPNMVPAYKTAELTEMYSYEEFTSALARGAAVSVRHPVTDPDAMAYLSEQVYYPQGVGLCETPKAAYFFAIYGGEFAYCVLMFSDSVID